METTRRLFELMGVVQRLLPNPKRTLFAQLIFDFVIILLFFIVLYFFYLHYLTDSLPSQNNRDGDWSSHAYIAVTPHMSMPNELFHSAYRWLGEGAWSLALIAAFSKSLTAALAAFLFVPRNQARAIIGCALALAMPVVILTVNHGFYIGQLAPNVLHNPTYIVMQPLALALWYLVSRTLSEPTRLMIALPVILFVSLLTTYAKPSFHLAALPAAAIIAAALLLGHSWRALRHGGAANNAALKSIFQRALKFLAIGLALAAPFLPQFFYILFGFENYHGGSLEFVFAPFAVFGQHVIDLNGMMIAGLVFPIVTAFIFRDRLFKDPFLKMGWVILGVGIAIAVLFAEPGDRLRHANFFWSMYISVFVLFCETARTAFNHPMRRWRGGEVACAIALTAHAHYGVSYINDLSNGGHPLAKPRAPYATLFIN